MNEQKLIEKLRLIEALFAGAATKGEKVAAELAKERILERLHKLEKEQPPVEYRFTMADMWSRRVFVALLRRYDIRPYRYKGQRYTTVMAKVSKKFVDETLWPEFQELSKTLHEYLSEITERIVSQVIHQDSSEAEVVDEKMMLPPVEEDPTPPTAPADSGKDKNTSKTNSLTKRKKRKKKGKR